MITSKKTALSGNTRPNKPLLSFLLNQKLNKKSTLIDFGSGQGRHTNYLRSCGYSTYSYDPYHGSDDVNGWIETSNQLPSSPVCICFSSYVLNVVHPQEIKSILNKIESLSSLNVIVIREDQALKNLFKKPHKTYDVDGFNIPYIETSKGLQSLIPPALLIKRGYKARKGVSTIFYKNMD